MVNKKDLEALGLLKKYKKKVDPHLREYFRNKKVQAKKIDPLALESVKMIENFTMSGGKRIRPALIYYGFLAAGGKDNEKIVKASMSIELTHTFLLIHDDIIDKDDLRHGVETIHQRYKQIAKKVFPKVDPVHFGNSMAIISGDMAASMGSEIMFNSEFSPELIVRALDKLQNIVYVTIPGEMIDVVLEAQGFASEEDVMRMYEGKTARYTFEGPLHLGAVLAGAKQNLLELFSQYSIPLGSAFQIRDDILGVFGQQKKMGKPVGSDIIEGKQTLLIVKALEFGTKSQKDLVKTLLGKQKINKKEIGQFRKAIVDSGSLDYAQKISEKLVDDSLQALEKIPFKNPASENFLKGIANFIIDRNH